MLRMARPGRDIRWSCARKNRYDTEKAARRAAEWARRKSGEGIESYACPHCGGWHIGHSGRRR